MIWGIVVASLYIVTCGSAWFGKKVTKEWRGKISVSHTIVGITLLLVSVLHMLLAFPLWKQRPLSMFILGFGLLLVTCIACIVCWCRKQVGRRWLRIHKVMAWVMLLLLIAHVVIGSTSFLDYKTKVAEIEIENVELSQIQNGEYIGEYSVGYVYAKVKVTIKEHRIENISLLEHGNEHGAPAETVVKDMVQKQSVKVDAVSGATNSSKVIMKAVEQALLRK